jgi:hypothetical protein
MTKANSDPSREVVITVEESDVPEKKRVSMESCASAFHISLPTLYGRWIHPGYLKTAYLRRQRFTTKKWMLEALRAVGERSFGNKPKVRK